MPSHHKQLWADAYYEAMEDLGMDSVDAEHYANNMVDTYYDHAYDRAKEDRLESMDIKAVKLTP